jgi:hypothetical protein
MPRRREWQLSIREGTGRPSHGILLTRRGGRGRFQASIRRYLLAKNDRAKFRFLMNQQTGPIPRSIRGEPSPRGIRRIQDWG